MAEHGAVIGPRAERRALLSLPGHQGACLRRRSVRIALLAWIVSAGGLPAQGDAAGEPPQGLDLYMAVPYQSADTAPLVALGRALFFDPILSRDSTIACATCHRPDRAFTDGRSVSRGIEGRTGTRNVPTLVNRGYGRAFSWDGRHASLEAQVLAPIAASDEMDAGVEQILVRLRRSGPRRRSFEQTVGRLPDGTGLASALAAFIRTLRSGGSRFDRFVAGELDALDDEEVRGMELFQGRARCSRCHFGPLLSDESFHNTGVAWRAGTPADPGRAAVTGRPDDAGAFKTPTLRDVSRTSPYMHDGSIATLEEVVAFYDGGGIANAHRDPLLRPLGLTAAEQRALVAFLETLESGERPR